jgi:hypothetical protein
MAGRIRGARRPLVFWAICPECFTYIWAEDSSISREEDLDCPYCEKAISLVGGADLTDSCKKLQLLLEDIENQIAILPAAIDVHRFLSEQVDYISQAFNDRLDNIQAEKDSAAMNSIQAGTPQAS